MPRVIHFEIPAKESGKVADFYRNVFGWKIQGWEGPMEYLLCSTGEKEEPGIDGAIYSPTEPFNCVVNTIGVENLDLSMSKVEENGGEIIVPKMVVPGVGYMLYCRDCEGTPFGLMQEDSSAGLDTQE